MKTAFPLAAGLAMSVLSCLPSRADEAISRSSSGYLYQHDSVADVPWSIHILRIDRASTDLHLQTTLANDHSFGLSSLNEQTALAARRGGRVIGAINGDFYDDESPYQGDPKGLQIMRGELISAPGLWTCLWIDEAGNANLGKVVSNFSVTWPDGKTTKMGLNERRASGAAVLYSHAVGPSTRTGSGGRELILEPEPGGKWLPLKVGEEYTVRVKEVRRTGNTPLTGNSLVLSMGPTLSRITQATEPGTILRISTATTPSIKGTVTAISGGPGLIHEKKVVYNRSQLRHPRSAIGWNTTHFFFVEVDGRQPNLSLGMTYTELSNYMLKLGCEEALNMDGGGSATLWVLGQVMNSPCEGHERSVANALILVQAPKSPAQSSSQVTPIDSAKAE